MTDILVDTRFTGQHGIARYAGEVIPRLDLEWSPFEPRQSPTSSIGLLSRRYLELRADSLLYSPGFNVGVSRARQVPTIHDLIHLDEPNGKKGILHSLYYQRVVRPAVLRAGHVFTVSRTSATAIQEWVGDSVAIHNTENGCSSAFTNRGEKFDVGAPYALYVGNLKAHKNPGLAFRAAARLPDLRLIVVTSDRAHGERLAQLHGISDRTTFRQSVDDEQLAALYRGACVLMFPSITEGFGLPVLEALKCGTPVAYLRACGSVEEICSGGQFPVDDGEDPNEFAKACLRAITEPFEQPELSRYDWDRVADRVGHELAAIRDELQ